MKTLVEPGAVFGRLTVVSEALPISYKWEMKRAMNCACACGGEKTVTLGALMNGRTQSCGCLRKEKSSQRIKASWEAQRSET